MLLSATIQRSVEAEIRNHPLEGDELRPLGCFDGLYVADADTEAVPSYLYVYTLEVGHKPYLVYRRITDQN